MALIANLVLAAALQAAAPPMAGMPGMAHAPATCPPTPVTPPPELTGWTRMTPLAAGDSVARAPLLTLGAGTSALLLPTPRMIYQIAPDKPGDANSSGGLFAFIVTEAGRYRVALGAGAWIDVVRDAAAVASVAHGHGPDCSGIRKMVDFDLRPGRYVLQVAGNASPTLPLLLTRLR